MCIPFLCQNSTLIVNLTFDNIRLLIEERITMLSKMFLLFRSSFLSRIQQKKVEGQTFLGFVLLLYLRMFTLFMAKIRLRLVQLNLVPLGTKGNYKEGKEIFLAIVLLCKLSCG